MDSDIKLPLLFALPKYSISYLISLGGVVSGGGVMEKASELLESLPSLLKFPAASEKELLATEMEA